MSLLIPVIIIDNTKKNQIQTQFVTQISHIYSPETMAEERRRFEEAEKQYNMMEDEAKGMAEEMQAGSSDTDGSA